VIGDGPPRRVVVDEDVFTIFDVERALLTGHILEYWEPIGQKVAD